MLNDDAAHVQTLRGPSEFEEEKSELSHTVRSTLRWGTIRNGTRRQKILAALAALVGFVLFVQLLHVGYDARSQLPSDDQTLLDTVLNNTLGFEKILVINLKKASTRRDRLALSASLSGIDLEFMDAVTPDEIDRTEIPVFHHTGLDIEKFPDKVFASYRSHMNAIRAVVEQNLGSALIMEDDTDWDIRIKQMLRDYAQTSRQLVQPLQNDPDQYLDPTYFKADRIKYNQRMPSHLTYTEWDYRSPPAAILEPSDCAYGDLDRWDLLWLGHCGQRIAKADTECYKTPLGRVLRQDDETAAETQWFRNAYAGNEYAQTYPNHTRVTHWSCAQVCNTAYAISNRGAKKLLYELGIKAFKGMTDQGIREVCEGIPPYNLSTCVSVSPPLFNQISYRRDKSWVITDNVRLSLSGNLDQLINNETLMDSFPDGTNIQNGG